MSAENGNGAAPKMSAENSGPVRLPNGQLVGGNPRNTGGKKGRSGRKPLNIEQEAERLLQKPKTRKALLAVIGNPNHQHFAAMWRALADRAWGKPAASLIIGNAPNAIEQYLLQRDQKRRLNQALANDEKATANPLRRILVRREVGAGYLTSKEMREQLVALMREHAVETGDAEAVALIDRLAESFLPTMLPDEEPESFTFDIDRPDVVATFPHNGRDPIPPSHEIIVTREHRGVDGRPIPTPPVEAPAPAPEAPIDPERARARARASLIVA